MKTIFHALIALSFCYKASGQAMGNQRYERSNNSYQQNSYQNQQQPIHDPASNTDIANPQEITLKVSGLYNIAPEHFVAVFNIVQIGETAEMADLFMSTRIQGFKQRLRALGMDTADIKTDVVSFVPKFDLQAENKLFSKSYNEVPAGFELQKNIMVYYRNANQLDGIMSAAVGSEIYDIVKVDYFIPNIQRSLDSLRLKCLREIKARVKSYEVLGFKLDTLKKTMTDRFTTTYPPDRYARYEAFSRPSLAAAKRKTSINEVQKPVTRFYNPIEPDAYDIVMNPIVKEPVVQLSYTVVVKYFLNREEKVINHYYIISSNGEVKAFNPK